MRFLAMLLVCAGCGDSVMTTGGGGAGGGSGGASGQGGQGGSAPDAAPTTMDAGPDASNLPTCPCWLGDGTYCALAVTMHGRENNCQVAALVGHEGDVFMCAGGVWTVSQPCSNGCYIAPDGTADACIPAGQPH